MRWLFIQVELYEESLQVLVTLRHATEAAWVQLLIFTSGFGIRWANKVVTRGKGSQTGSKLTSTSSTNTFRRIARSMAHRVILFVYISVVRHDESDGVVRQSGMNLDESITRNSTSWRGVRNVFGNQRESKCLDCKNEPWESMRRSFDTSSLPEFISKCPWWALWEVIKPLSTKSKNRNTEHSN